MLPHGLYMPHDILLAAVVSHSTAIPIAARWLIIGVIVFFVGLILVTAIKSIAYICRVVSLLGLSLITRGLEYMIGPSHLVTSDIDDEAVRLDIRVTHRRLNRRRHNRPPAFFLQRKHLASA